MVPNKNAARLGNTLRNSSFFRWTLFSLGSFVAVFFLTVLCAEVFMLPEDWAFLPPVVILFFWNFITMRYFVYGSPVIPMQEQFINYSCSAIAFRSAEFLVYWILVSKLGVRYTNAVVVVMPASFIAKFFFYKSHVFTSRPFHKAATDSLSRSDIHTLAELHRECLPESMVTQLGIAYVKSFYQYVLRSESEFLLIRRRNEKICTACVVSLEPKSLSRRLFLETPLALSLLMRLPHLLKKNLSRTRGKALSDSAQPVGRFSEIEKIPELLLIYSSSHVRGQGLGAEIMKECEAELMKRGFDQYSLKTIEDDSNQATRFYQRQGLQKQYSIHKHGRLFSVLTKTLPHSPPSSPRH